MDVDVESIKPVSAGNKFENWLNGRKARVCFWVPEKVRVLDIGCGFGETLLYHRQRGCEAYGIEVDDNVERAAEKHQLNIKTNDFSASDYEENYFDFITMDQVIEHIQDPKSMLVKFESILNDNGKIIISTPNANGWGARFFRKKWINWHAPYHLHFFSRQTMQTLISDTVLEIEEYKHITSSEWLYYQFMHLLTYPERGVKSLFWLNQPLQNKRNILLRRVLNVLKRIKVFDLITRLFDSIGMGDNHIFVLKKQLTNNN